MKFNEIKAVALSSAFTLATGQIGSGRPAYPYLGIVQAPMEHENGTIVPGARVAVNGKEGITALRDLCNELLEACDAPSA